MQELLQTAALLILTLSHCILQWRCRDYQTKSQTFTEWIQSRSIDFDDHFNEFGGILTDIATALETSPSQTNPNASESVQSALLGALINGVSNRIGHASEETDPTRDLRQIYDNTTKEE